MSEIFISYARSTAAQAQLIAGALRGLGYAVWMDDALPSHRPYGDVLRERLTAAKAVLVIWSADAARSDWVRSEANVAREARKLVQLTIDGAELPMPFDQIQCASLAGWSGEPGTPAWRNILGSLAELAGPPAASAPAASPAAAAAPSPPMLALLFADIEGASLHWLNQRTTMQEASDAYQALMREAAAAHGGDVYRTAGEAVFAAFSRPADAMLAAREAEAALAARSWPGVGALCARMAVDFGPAELRNGDAFGAAVNRCGRLLALGHGGQVLVTQAAADGAGAQTPLRRLGAHPLDDPLQAVGIHQLLIEGLPRDFPPLRLPDARPNNLPRRHASLVGRQAELGQLAALLESADLVTLTGAGGVGKTRLAVEVGQSRLGDFEDGVWLAELAPVSDPEQVPAAIARAMSIELPAGQPPLDALVDRLRLRSCLVVLDNCEHLLDAVAALAEAILEQSSHVKLLATSQELLGVEGEQVFRLRSLGEPDAVTLFAERAHAADTSFSLTAQSAAAVAAICQRLDGIPLAIEMAAARAPTLGCEGVLQRLDDRFRVLTGGRRTALPRQRTLLATLDWSHGLLSERDAAVFGRLGVFVGGFSLEAAAEVAADAATDRFEVTDALSSLVAKSLVVADVEETHARYRLLETTRAYALEKLAAAGETAATQRRHAACFLSLAVAAREDYFGHKSDDDFAARYASEIHNVTRALEWAFGPEGDVELGIALVVNTEAFWAHQSLYPEYFPWLELALSRLAPATPLRMRVELLKANATSLMMNYPLRALEATEEAVEACRALDDPIPLIQALNARGFTLWFAGRLAQSPEVSAESTALVAGLPPSRLTAQTLMLEGYVRFGESGPEAALAPFEKAIGILRSFGADGAANFFAAQSRNLIPWPSPAVAIIEWRNLLTRVRPTEMLAGMTMSVALIQLTWNLGLHGDANDRDEALGLCRTYVKVVPTSWRHALHVPLALLALQSGRTGDAARIAGFAEAMAAQTGMRAIYAPLYDELWTRLRAAAPEAELTALAADGAQMKLEDALALALGER